jgi:putative heme iron utilization protein
MVAYAVDPAGAALFFHVSQLAQHTRNLLEQARCSLVISEQDPLDGDPQRLQRVTLTGLAAVVQRSEAAYVAAADAYIARFPDAQLRFELGDFLLVRFTPEDVRYVGGFARTGRFAWTEILPDLT